MSLSISALEKQLMDRIFRSGSSFGETAGAPTQISLQQTQEMMTKYAFQDFVNFFLNLESEAKKAAQRTAQNAPSMPGPLYASQLHLDIQIERYKQVGAAEVAGSQPVTVQKLKTDMGMASKIEIRTPELHSDGSVSYTVTLLKLAVSIDEIQPRPDLAQGQVVGSPIIPATGETAGEDLEEFLNHSPFSGEAETIFDYENEDAMELLSEQKKLDDWQAAQQLKVLVEIAYKILKAMQAEEYDNVFNLTKEESELIQNAMTGNISEITRKALTQFIQKKRIELEMLRKELKERMEAQEDSHKIAAKQEKVEKLLNVLDNVQQVLNKQPYKHGRLAEMLEDFNKVNIQSNGTSFSDMSMSSASA